MTDSAEPTEEPNNDVTQENAKREDATEASAPTEAPEVEEPAHTKEELQAALKAFRKRLRLMRLDDESRMGYGPTSSGQSSGIVAITPPNQFPMSVWRELAKQGKIKRDRGTLFSLVE